MSEINKIILDKLRDYDPAVSELALKAIELAGQQNSEAMIVEYLENHARKIIKNMAEVKK